MVYRKKFIIGTFLVLNIDQAPLIEVSYSLGWLERFFNIFSAKPNGMAKMGNIEYFITNMYCQKFFNRSLRE